MTGMRARRRADKTFTSASPVSQRKKQTGSILNVQVTCNAVFEPDAIQEQDLLIRMNPFFDLYLFLNIQQVIVTCIYQQLNLSSCQYLYLNLADEEEERGLLVYGKSLLDTGP